MKNEHDERAARAEAMAQRGADQARRVREAVAADSQALRDRDAARREQTRPLRRGAP